MISNERDRGILSPADRAFLRGETEYESIQSERNARARIRERIYQALLDFELLMERLETHDRELIFEKRLQEMEGADALDAVVSAMAFLYAGIDMTDLEFDDILMEAVNVAEARNNRAAIVDLELTYHSLSTKEVLQKLRTGKSLSLTEIAYLQRSDDVPNDELANYFDQQQDPIDDGRIQAKVTNY